MKIVRFFVSFQVNLCPLNLVISHPVKKFHLTPKNFVKEFNSSREKNQL